MSYSRIKTIVVGMVIVGAAVPVSAAMTTGTFVTRANALRSQGFAALLSPDFQVLKEEARQARAQLKVDSATRVRAGRKTIACIPDGETIGIEEMIDALARQPLAVQRQPLRIGYAKVLTQRFPC